MASNDDEESFYISRASKFGYKDEGTTNFSVKNDMISTVRYPWRRFFARSLDTSVYMVIWSAFSLLVLRWSLNTSAIMNLINAYIYYGMMLVIEPLLLSTCGTTIGKWVFGLVIRDRNDQKLTYKQAFYRTFSVFGSGMGYNIPIYSLVRQYKSYKACMAGEPMSWEEDDAYTIKDKKSIRAVAYIGLEVVFLCLSFLIFLQSRMPINRGDITAAQYYENCNDIMSTEKIDFGENFNEQGQWVEDEFDGGYTISLISQPLPEHVLTITDGKVTGVKIEIEIEANSDEWITGYVIQKYIAAMSFIGAQKEINCIHIFQWDITQTLIKDFEDYSFIEAGVRVTNKVEYSGYDLLSDQYLMPIEGEQPYFHMIFTMEKVAP